MFEETTPKKQTLWQKFNSAPTALCCFATFIGTIILMCMSAGNSRYREKQLLPPPAFAEDTEETLPKTLLSVGVGIRDEPPPPEERDGERRYYVVGRPLPDWKDVVLLFEIDRRQLFLIKNPVPKEGPEGMPRKDSLRDSTFIAVRQGESLPAEPNGQPKPTVLVVELGQ
jgi:hypothetical protein